mmetsp:Transcript_76214/g.231096  ORF Transcript_76214/g.231096 Transcript_76214/m.231096 type:complete len:212 (-) Transcript_76214:82-717(-)
MAMRAFFRIFVHHDSASWTLYCWFFTSCATSSSACSAWEMSRSSASRCRTRGFVASCALTVRSCFFKSAHSFRHFSWKTSPQGALMASADLQRSMQMQHSLYELHKTSATLLTIQRRQPPSLLPCTRATSFAASTTASICASPMPLDLCTSTCGNSCRGYPSGRVTSSVTHTMELTSSSVGFTSISRMVADAPPGPFSCRPQPCIRTDCNP